MEIKINTDRLEKRLDGLAKEQIPFAVAGAINSTVIQIRDAQQKEMLKVFDRPTPFTLKGVLFTKATKEKPIAQVFIGAEGYAFDRSEDRDYLLPQVRGGSRKEKGSERRLRAAGILPTGLYISPAHRVQNQYGNIPGQLMTKVLSGLQSLDIYAGSSQNRTAASIQRKTRKGQKPKEYFVKRYASGHPIGIFERKGNNAQGLPIVFFIGKPSYKKRLNFTATGAKVAKENWQANILKSIRYAISTAKK